MATTLHNRVEDYIGSNDPNIEQSDWLTAISEWLTATAREIFEVVPLERLAKVSPEPGDVLTTGYPLKGKRIVSVHNDSGYVARPYPASNKDIVKDTGSIHYATDESPIYYIEGGSLYLVGDGAVTAGKINYIETPLVDYDQTEIANFPTELETLVVLGAAIRGRIRQLSDRREKLREYVEVEEDMELASGVTAQINAMQAELQALQAQFQQELQILAKGMESE